MRTPQEPATDSDIGELRPSIDIEWAVASGRVEVPETRICQWVNACANEIALPAFELSVRVVDDPEMRDLNHRFRDSSNSTNVLSFANGIRDESGRQLLGDIVICAPVLLAEAQAQQKSVEEHFAHLIIHGLLHLRGYDHQDDGEAREMETVEVRLMRRLGFENPYLEMSL